MKRLYFFLAMFFCVSLSFAQGTSSSTAILLTPGDVLPQVAGNMTVQASLVNYCLSAVTGEATTTCSPAVTDAKWFRFTVPSAIPSAAVRVTVNPTGFDAVIDFYAGTAASPIYKECSNTAGSGTSEILRTTWATNPISPGTEYYFRVSSTTDVASGCFDVKVEYFPTAYVSSGSPNPTVDAGLVGYKVTNNLKRNYPSFTAQNNLVQGTRFRVVDASDATNTCTGTLTGTLDQKILYDFPCVCYGKTYNVWVELKMDGIWCGEGPVRTITMEAYPNTTINNVSCQSQLLQGGQLTTSTLGPNAVLEWEFSTNGTVISTVQTASSTTNIFLNNANLSCLRYNRIYSVRVRVRYCNVWGEWSAPYCLITAPLPVLTITGAPPAYANICNSTISRYSIIYTQFVQGATQYIWQIAPVSLSAPLVPTGPAIVATTATEVLQLATQPLQSNTSYRIAAKPFLNSCSDPQQGDYGYFCVITTSAAVQNPNTSQAALAEEEVVEHRNENGFQEMEVEEQGNVAIISFAGYDQRIATLRLVDEAAVGKGMIQMVDMSGNLLYSKDVFIESIDQLIQIPLPENVAAGLYMISFRTPQHSVTEKFLVK